jgi:phosphatidate cytidylyltransferase
MSAPAAPRVRFADLGPRVLSGLALAAIALADLWLGGWWLAGLAAIAAGLMMWELHRMVTGAPGGLAPALAVMALAAAAAVLAARAYGIEAAVGIALAGAAVAAALAAPGQRRWLAGGMIYAAVAMSYATALRDSELHGLPMVLWLILVVIAADVGAYFVGRLMGGPKLWPAVSPGKTWSGALGGLALAVVVGVGFGMAHGWDLSRIAALSAAVALASQAGDLAESALKRRFGVKDASRLIPGHGGVMDRLDGVMGALWFFALYDLAGGRFGA